jgi:hypothetical protein
MASSNLPKGWSFGGGGQGGNWRYGNDPMSPLLDDKVTGPGGMGVGSDQTSPTLQQIIDALQAHADQSAVGVSGETPEPQPTSGPPADTLASIATGQMSPTGSGGDGSGGGGGPEGAAPSSSGEGEGDGSGGPGGGGGDGSGGGSGGGSGAGSAMRRGGKVGQPARKVRRPDMGGMRVGRQRGVDQQDSWGRR